MMHNADVFQVGSEPAKPDSSKIENLIRPDNDLLEGLESIPDKMAFKIGEVAELTGVKQYVLRYWESEFDALRPKKSNHNQRMYSKKDVELVFLIKKLLYKDRFSIEGAKSAIRKLRKDIRSSSSYRENFRKFHDVVGRARTLVADIEKLRSRI